MRRRRGFGSRTINIQPSRSAAILRILNAGWHRVLACADVGPATGEVVLTGHLISGMRAAVNDRTVSSHKKISVLPGTESHSGTVVTPTGLTDIAIHLRDIRERTRDHGPHAIIECKRVAGNHARLCRLYVVDGIDRFRTGQYADRHAVGFMAAYVLSGSVESATGGINRHLSFRGRVAECLNPSTVLTEVWARSSWHPRPTSAAPIELHHAILVFRAVP